MEKSRGQLQSGEYNFYSRTNIESYPRLFNTELAGLDAASFDKKVRKFVEETFDENDEECCCEYFISPSDSNGLVFSEIIYVMFDENVATCTCECGNLMLSSDTACKSCMRDLKNRIKKDTADEAKINEFLKAVKSIGSVGKCAICGENYVWGGYNPSPVIEDKEFRCCSYCNDNEVMTARFEAVVSKARENKEPERIKLPVIDVQEHYKNMVEVVMKCANLDDISFTDVIDSYFLKEFPLPLSMKAAQGFDLFNKFIPDEYLYDSYKDTVTLLGAFIEQEQFLDEKLLERVLMSKTMCYDATADNELLQKYCDGYGYITVYTAIPTRNICWDRAFWFLSYEVAAVMGREMVKCLSDSSGADTYFVASGKVHISNVIVCSDFYSPHYAIVALPKNIHNLNLGEVQYI